MRLPCLILLLLTSIARAELIDEIAITVGNQAITRSEITRDIRLSALLNGGMPDYGAESRRKSADRLIEQALVRREMSLGSYPAVPSEQIAEAYANTGKEHGGRHALEKLLAESSLTQEDVKSYLQWQLLLLKFIEFRFRPAVQVSSEDVEKYYRENVSVQTSAAGKAPALRDVQAEIEQKLTGDRVDRQVDQWIKRAKARTTIRYLDSSLGATQPAPLDRDGG